MVCCLLRCSNRTSSVVGSSKLWQLGYHYYLSTSISFLNMTNVMWILYNTSKFLVTCLKYHIGCLSSMKPVESVCLDIRGFKFSLYWESWVKKMAGLNMFEIGVTFRAYHLELMGIYACSSFPSKMISGAIQVGVDRWVVFTSDLMNEIVSTEPWSTVRGGDYVCSRSKAKSLSRHRESCCQQIWWHQSVGCDCMNSETLKAVSDVIEIGLKGRECK